MSFKLTLAAPEYRYVGKRPITLQVQAIGRIGHDIWINVRKSIQISSV